MTDVAILPLAPAEFFPAASDSAHLPLIEDDELVSILEGAAESELDGLVRCLIEKGGITCQLKRLKVFKENQPHHRFYARDIAAEIQKYGANTLASHAFRSGKGVYYAEIVRDVASKLRVPLLKDVREMEASIQAKLLEEFWRGLSVEQRRALLESLNVRDYSSIAKAAAPSVLLKALNLSGFAAYKASVIVANAAAHALLGHGLSFAANAALTKGLAVVLGPVGWSLASFLSANSLASEAYRVTIPSVLQVSMIRHANLEREKLRKRRILSFWAWRIFAIILFFSAAMLVYQFWAATR